MDKIERLPYAIIDSIERSAVTMNRIPITKEQSTFLQYVWKVCKEMSDAFNKGMQEYRKV